MKKLIFLLLLPVFAWGQPYRSLMVKTNGELASPTNFWDVNASSILDALDLSSDSVTTNDARWLQFTNPTNQFIGVFTGNGNGLTNLSLVAILAAFPSGVSNYDTRALSFTNPANQLVGVFSGNGANLTNLPIPSGLLSNYYVLPVVLQDNLTISNGNIGFTNYGGTATLYMSSPNGGGLGSLAFNGAWTFSGVTGITANQFAGSGAGLTSLPANQLSGTVPLSALPSSVLTNGYTLPVLLGTNNASGSNQLIVASSTKSLLLGVNTTGDLTIGGQHIYVPNNTYITAGSDANGLRFLSAGLYAGSIGQLTTLSFGNGDDTKLTRAAALWFRMGDGTSTNGSLAVSNLLTTGSVTVGVSGGASGSALLLQPNAGGASTQNSTNYIQSATGSSSTSRLIFAGNEGAIGGVWNFGAISGYRGNFGASSANNGIMLNDSASGSSAGHIGWSRANNTSPGAYFIPFADGVIMLTNKIAANSLAQLILGISQSTNTTVANTYLTVDGSRTTAGNVFEYTTNNVNKFAVTTAGAVTAAGIVSAPNANISSYVQLNDTLIRGVGSGRLSFRTITETAAPDIWIGPTASWPVVSATTNNGASLLTLSSSISLTNGAVAFSQLTAIPTNAILASSAGNTNWTLCNLTNTIGGGGPTFVATNTAAAGSFLISRPTLTVTTYP